MASIFRSTYNGLRITGSHRPTGVLDGLDVYLLACVCVLMCFGLAFIASATLSIGESGPTPDWSLLTRQGVFLGLGVIAFLLVQKIDYRNLLQLSPLLYLAMMILLTAVLFTRPINGARSWFRLYYVNLQPSELMKPVLILTLAHYLMYRESYKRLSGLVVPLLLGFLPMILILRQPDLGTALTLAPVVVALLYAAGARWQHLLMTGFCGAGGLVGMWFTVMKDYQKRRILAWLNPEEYRLNEAWQLIHAEIAIGSGGVWGQGWGSGQESTLHLLPEKHTDFIFAVVAEEGGFMLAGLLVGVFALLVLGGLHIAARTREPAGRLIAVGVTVLFAGQALINMGVAMGMLPTTGITLPFVSYGGSSLISSFVCLGLLCNVAAHKDIVLTRDQFS